MIKEAGIMKLYQKITSYIVAITLVFGCLALIAPKKVEAKAFDSKKVDVKVIKDKFFPSDEDGSYSKYVVVIHNENKQMAEVTFTVVCMSSDEVGETYERTVEVADFGYCRVGDSEDDWSDYKIKDIKVKKYPGKRIKKKKVKVKVGKKNKKGVASVTIKNNSKYKGYFEITNVFYNKKGKVVYISSTDTLKIKPGKKKKSKLGYVPYNLDNKKIKYKKMKTYKNYYYLPDKQ